MNFLLDENVPRSLKQFLQKKGHSILLLDELNMRGAVNGEVAKLSIEKNAIIITFDSDFLKLKKDIEKKIRAIYIELHPRDPKVARELLAEQLDNCLTHLKSPNIILLTPQGITLKK